MPYYQFCIAKLYKKRLKNITNTLWLKKLENIIKTLNY